MTSSIRVAQRADDNLVTRIRWTARLVRVLTPRELRTRYRQSVLDLGWALLNPVAVLIIYGIVLTQSFGVTGGSVPYLTSAWCGLILWTFFSSAVGGAAASLIYSADLVTKVYFPKEALPLSIVGASLADLGIGLVSLFVLMPIQGVPFSPEALYGILPLLVLLVWTAALSVFTAVLAAFIRDITQLVTLVLRVGFFATPVMYSSSDIPSALAWTASLSPIAVAIEGFRVSVLMGETPDLPLITVQLVCGVALLGGSVLYTRAVESRIADVV
jgi:lipopolysaccharide transport system permease protein